MRIMSELELQKLRELYRVLAPAKNSNTDNSDNINDFIFEQIDIKVKDNGELAVLASARKHFEIENKAMIEAFEIVELLVSHFDN